MQTQQNETRTIGGAARDQRIKSLIRVGEMEMTGEDQAEIDAYFAPTSHSTARTGPSGTTRA